MLDLSSSNFTQGPIPKWVRMMPNLQYFDLAYCNLTNQILGFLGRLTTLQTFWLRGNLLNGSIPHIFANLIVFMSLDVSQNWLACSITLSLMEVLNLKMIELYAN